MSRKLLFLIRKEFIQFTRIRAMLALTFGVPVIQLVILGFAISGDVERIPSAIIDLDNTPVSRSIVNKLETTRYLDIQQHPGDMREIIPLMKNDEIILAVTIPKGFERDLMRGERPELSVNADAQNTNVAVIGAGYIRRIMQSWAQSFPGGKTPQTHVIPIGVSSRIRYNEELKNIYYMVPGIIVLLVTIITMFLTALAIVRERELGTLEQLMVTPISRIEMILGKTIPFAIVGFVEMCFAYAVARVVYHIPVAGSLPLFFAIALLFIFCTLGTGMFISTIAHTQQQALFTAWFFMIFFILMSGFFLPLDNMPEAALAMTYINPLRYFLVIVRDIFLKGAGAAELVREIVSLAVLAFSVNVLAVLRFNKRLD